MDAYAPLLALIALPALPLFWCAVVLLLSRVGGWHRLHEEFPERGDPAAIGYRGVSGRVGLVSYNQSLRVAATGDGLHLAVPSLFRPGHPPLFIPWRAMRRRERLRLLWQDSVRVEIGSTGVKLQLPAEWFESVPG
jgi:hypothetical protein